MFIKKGEPVEIITEYEHWRNIRDIKGEGGWVHLSLLSTKRAVIIINKEAIPLTKSPTTNSKIVALISPNVRCQLNKCKDSWCRVKCKNYEGWVPRNLLWGVYKDEKF
jgi:SH3-like domain-containing protein